MKLLPIFPVALLALVFTSCESSSSKVRYPVSTAGVAQSLDKGTIINVRDVVLDGRTSTIGAYGGALLEAAALGARSERKSLERAQALR